jgi:hypothetical protein
MNSLTTRQTQLWNVALLGARMHYAVPRLLHQAGLLEHFYTDICAIKGWPRLLTSIPTPLQPKGIQRLLGRIPQGIPPAQITAFNHLGWSYAKKLRQAHTTAETTAAFLWSGKTFCKLVLEQGLTPNTGIYTFNSAGLEILQAARQQNLPTVMEQTIAPRALERQLLDTEQQAHPNWHPLFGNDPSLTEYIDREQQEWQTAGLILCGSEFVRDGIAACGGPVDRCRVIPYGVDLPIAPIDRLPHNGPLRILTVGSIGLRKGSPYVLAAARQLRGKATFRLVGSVHDLTTDIQSQLADNLELIGSVPRSQIREHYAWADVFLLPSICEGSATVTYEALATGLPVICTTNTGSVIRDGQEGFIIPMRDATAIATKIEILAQDPDRLAQMSINARQRAQEFTLEAYGQRLISLLTTNHMLHH